MRVESVTSAQNRKVKTLLALQEKARLRKEMGLFVVEGRRELGHCVRAGFEIDTLFYCPEIAGCSGIHLPETSFGPPPSKLGSPPLTMPRVARFSGTLLPPYSTPMLFLYLPTMRVVQLSGTGHLRRTDSLSGRG